MEEGRWITAPARESHQIQADPPASPGPHVGAHGRQEKIEQSENRCRGQPQNDNLLGIQLVTEVGDERYDHPLEHIFEETDENFSYIECMFGQPLVHDLFLLYDDIKKNIDHSFIIYQTR